MSAFVFINVSCASKLIKCIKLAIDAINKKLSEKWNDVLFKLDQRMLYYIKNEKFDTVKLKTFYKSGLELESTSIWGDNGYLTWENLINKKCEPNLNLF